MDRSHTPCPIALVVEDDADVRNLATAVLEESDLDVIACDTAEAAISVLERSGGNVALLFADVRLGSGMDGIALASTVERRWPDVRVVLTSGGDARGGGSLPAQAVYMQKPWRALDVLVQAEHAAEAARAA
ncbi:response regulator receiver protein [Methylobacterium sp. Leaf113]|uniref:response regulator n=1 Tax=unclassified Methylobacterium TaxID=2615210 RepID=UPI0006FE4D58|nr:MULTISPECIES: response regulator [unclassified Methylobacterium]KQP82612.1 response regulator receiver protein [Methylobacterium sp. Leaf117]KQP93010.1 response regulator receiver protein [Methylobacterium sp. Leaf113]